MPFPENILAPNEAIRFFRRPHWLALLGACARIAICLAVYAIAASIAASAENVDGPGLALYAAVVTVDGVVLIRNAFDLIAISLRILSTRYLVTTDRVVLQWVVLSRKGSEVPLMQITAVEYHQSPIARLFRYGDLRFKSSASGTEVRFRYIHHPRQVRAEIYRLIEMRVPKAGRDESQL